MLFSKLLSGFCLAAVACARAAPVSRDSPRGAMYEAVFNKPGGIRGSVRFYSVNGYLKYDIDVRNLPKSGGPFLYHIHVKPVPPSGDCYATLGHLNPYDGKMDAPTLAEYEVGDLSGKHGTIPGRRFRKSIYEVFASLNPKNPAFIGNDRSVVFHLHDNTRIACANIRRISSGDLDAPVNMGDDHAGPDGLHAGMDSGVDSGMDQGDSGLDAPKNDTRLDGSRLSKFVT